MFIPLTLDDFVRQFLSAHPSWSQSDLWYHAMHPHYTEHKIEKKQYKKSILMDGTDVIIPKMRVIHEPCPGLKVVHEFILRMILNPAIDCLLPCAHGCVPGRSTVTNAAPHVGCRIKIHMDMKDFFPSITVQRIYGMYLRTFKYEPRLTWLLANLSTFKGKAPQGAATSPMLANLIATSMDRRLIWLTSAFGGFYTRYVDDLTFSFRRFMTNANIDHFIKAVRKISRKQGFRVNEEKTSVVSSGDRMIATGIVVNTKVSIPERFRKRVRASMQQSRLEIPSADPVEVIKGNLAYINGVCKTQAESLIRADRKARTK